MRNRAGILVALVLLSLIAGCERAEPPAVPATDVSTLTPSTATAARSTNTATVAVNPTAALQPLHR
jgi:predicted component of type VI protein secretion system